MTASMLIGIHRLGQVVPGARLDALLPVALHGLGRHGDDRQVACSRGILRISRMVSMPSISGIMMSISTMSTWPGSAENADRVAAVVGRHDDHVVLLQHAGQREDVADVVVHDQDLAPVRTASDWCRSSSSAAAAPRAAWSTRRCRKKAARSSSRSRRVHMADRACLDSPARRRSTSCCASPVARSPAAWSGSASPRSRCASTGSSSACRARVDDQAIDALRRQSRSFSSAGPCVETSSVRRPPIDCAMPLRSRLVVARPPARAARSLDQLAEVVCRPASSTSFGLDRLGDERQCAARAEPARGRPRSR